MNRPAELQTPIQETPLLWTRRLKCRRSTEQVHRIWLEPRGVGVPTRIRERSQCPCNMPSGCAGHPQQGPINPSLVPTSPNTHKCKVNSWIKAFNVLCTVLFEKIRSDI